MRKKKKKKPYGSNTISKNKEKKIKERKKIDSTEFSLNNETELVLLGSIALTQKRLDSALVNLDWRANFPAARSSQLDFFGSDHIVLSLELGLCPTSSLTSCNKGKRFLYEALWNEDPKCQHIISNSWLPVSEFSSLDTVITNIASCSENLDSWYLKKYSTLPKDIRCTKRKLSTGQNVDHDLYNQEEVSQLESYLSHLFKKEEISWQQRSRVQRLQVGDQNTKYFYRHASARFQNNLIQGS
ncbi:uncharacterized protein LOC133038196 [Cannabis sativa]|uniref:uncharacterized protein LOC133038196 n=1 Tax=Cannabis sativa TaxID=3483 RepID=UPI0029C9BDB2|nr:uncharacterized protein LOC133038196 [Cannabis sativa]